jgi:hypothetical protein
MKKLLTLITGASLADIQKRMNTVEHRNDMYKNIIARRTVKIGKVQSTVVPTDWIEEPNHMQMNAWYGYITTVRDRK